MSDRWSVKDAQSRFDELLDAAITEGPQFVTRHGVETAVVIDVGHWRRLKGSATPDLKELLLAPEARTENLTPPRRRRRHRKSVGVD